MYSLTEQSRIAEPTLLPAHVKGITMVDHVQSLARGLAVIRAFSATDPELTLSQVARATGLSRAAARR
jgi:response regulator of citrate/malate metabolism